MSREATHSQKEVNFWKPGSAQPGKAVLEERTDHGPIANYNPNSLLSVEVQRGKLPVYTKRTQILYLLENYQTLIVNGETGSGKSTQIPQYVLEAGWASKGFTVAVTQPRRVATVSVATRVADERGSSLGTEIGYKVRFDDCTDESTKVKFLTDGMIVREMMTDPLLSSYSVIMLDEAHERTLHTDVVLGLLKKILKKRPELRLIVSSATLDAEKFKNFFNIGKTEEGKSLDTAVILSIEGRAFPVDVHYAVDPFPDYLKATVETIMRIHRNEGPGDILAFLTGMEEVERIVSILIDQAREQKSSKLLKLQVLPMHGSLPIAHQMKVFQRTAQNTRKVVIATNIAEASITINGVVYVVDSGFVKIKAYNPEAGIESLVVVKTSKASAVQRTGRAGRVRAGKSYRLYTEKSFDEFPAETVPEMQRSDMAPVILQMKALGIENVVRFDFMSPPPAKTMLFGIDLLYALEGIDEKGNLTDPVGLRMAEFPLHPMFAKMLLCSGEMECSEEILTITAMTQIQNIFTNPPNQRLKAERAKRLFSVAEGDHITLLNVYTAFIENGQSPQWCQKHYLNYKGLLRATSIRDQLKRLLQRYNIPLVDCQGHAERVRKCLVKGFFANAAKLHYLGTGVYRTLRSDHELHIHPSSVLFREVPPKWVIFNEVVHTKRELMRDITAIEPEWLQQLAPHYYQYGTAREKHSKRMKL